MPGGKGRARPSPNTTCSETPPSTTATIPAATMRACTPRLHRSQRGRHVPRPAWRQGGWHAWGQRDRRQKVRTPLRHPYPRHSRRAHPVGIQSPHTLPAQARARPWLHHQRRGTLHGGRVVHRLRRHPRRHHAQDARSHPNRPPVGPDRPLRPHHRQRLRRAFRRALRRRHRQKEPPHPLGMRDLGRHLTRRACGTRPPGPPGPQARPPRRNGLRDQPRRAKRPEGLPCTPHRTDLFCCRIRRRRMSVGVWRRHHGRLMRPPV